MTTSPRSPEKMIPEIALLSRHFTGKKWDRESQREYMELLREEDFFNGSGQNDPSFSARDRINRAPKALGFVRLSPSIRLTPAGEKLLKGKRVDEVFLRQMLKFQIPSPYHKPGPGAAKFCIKPYLEMLRLVSTLGTLKFDELQLFGMQLTDWHSFDDIVEKIDLFRKAKAQSGESYKKLRGEYLRQQLVQIYRDRIRSGETGTRESSEKSLRKFLRTRASNMRDYADACLRYLRATGLVQVSQEGRSLSIVPERTEEAAYLLEHIDRSPKSFKSETEYVEYLEDATTPALLSDNRDFLLQRIRGEFPSTIIPREPSTEKLKDLLSALRQKRKETALEQEIRKIKDYSLYDDIETVFEGIATNKYYDTPLMLEWNTWRAVTMLDGGEVKGSFTSDDFGNPLSTAAGNRADIVCDYEDFLVTVEVTMSEGQRQFETEGEPVSRHLGKLRTTTGKPCFCLFIAPHISDATIAFFYTLYRTHLKVYGGRSIIVPLPLSIFRKMLEDSYRATYIPDPSQVRSFFEASDRLALEASDESMWYEDITGLALDWLGGKVEG